MHHRAHKEVSSVYPSGYPSIYIFFLQLKTRLGGSAALMGINAFFFFYFLYTFSFLLSFLPILFAQLCLCLRLLTVHKHYLSHEGVLTAVHPSRSPGLYWQSLTARTPPFIPHHYQQWTSCKQHPLLSAYLKSPTIWTAPTSRKQQHPSCTSH